MMKNVIIKNNFFQICFICFICFSCNKNIESNRSDSYKNSTDSITGVFLKFPYFELTENFISCKNDLNIRLLKKITKKNIEYILLLNNSNDTVNIPILREVNDFTPKIQSNLNQIFESQFTKTSENIFIVEFDYGTSHILWNYLYVVEKNKIYLKDIFISEPYKNYVKETDTISQTSHFNLKDKNLLFIDSLYNHFEKVKNVNQKWILKKHEL